MNLKKEKLNSRMGDNKKKILLALAAGVALAISARPDISFKIIKGIAEEWEDINRQALQRAIKSLYKSKMIDYRHNNDGTISITLAENGKKKILQYNFDSMEIKKPKKWDKLWRIVIFDIPEEHRQARTALAEKLKNLGFISMQKSVFIHPYECSNEVNFITEIFEVRPYVRLIHAQQTDIDIDLKNRFSL